MASEIYDETLGPMTKDRGKDWVKDYKTEEDWEEYHAQSTAEARKERMADPIEVRMKITLDVALDKKVLRVREGQVIKLPKLTADGLIAQGLAIATTP